MADEFVCGPGTMGLPAPTGVKGMKGGSGEYDGIKGWQGRTPSPNGVPEKFMDSLPGGEKGDD